MKAYIKITARLLEAVRRDLDRSHAFAHERVGFLTAGATSDNKGNIFLLVRDYMPIADQDYIRNPAAGATIGADAMRKGLQHAYKTRATLLHIHSHGGRGRPAFSSIDLSSGKEFVPGFFNVIPQMPHGLLVLSEDSACGLVWQGSNRAAAYAVEFCQVGAPYIRFGGIT